MSLEYDWWKGMLVWDWFSIILPDPHGFVEWWVVNNEWLVTFPSEAT